MGAKERIERSEEVTDATESGDGSGIKEGLRELGKEKKKSSY